MANILVIYASKYGQTKKIADAIAKHLHSYDHSLSLLNIDHISSKIDLNQCDAVIIGASVHAGEYSSKLQEWIKTNHQLFASKPTAFYSVCLGILQKDEKVQTEEQKIKEGLFDRTGWRPSLSEIFAGALEYSKYNWFLKRIMRRIVRKAGIETDMTKDYEYTNWKQVEDFARKFHSIMHLGSFPVSDGLYVSKKSH